MFIYLFIGFLLIDVADRLLVSSNKTFHPGKNMGTRDKYASHCFNLLTVCYVLQLLFYKRSVRNEKKQRYT